MSDSTDGRPGSVRIERRLLGPNGGRPVAIAATAGALVVVGFSTLSEPVSFLAGSGLLLAGYLRNRGPSEGAFAGILTASVAILAQYLLSGLPGSPVPPGVAGTTSVDSGIELVTAMIVAYLAFAPFVAGIGALLGWLGGEFAADGPIRSPIDSRLDVNGADSPSTGTDP